MSIENEVKKLTAVTQQLVDAIVKHNLLIAGEDPVVLTAEPEQTQEPEQPAEPVPEAPKPTVTPAAGETSASLMKRRGRKDTEKPAGLPFEVPNA